MGIPHGYSQAVQAGDTLYVSGQLSHDSTGAFIGAGDFELQVRTTLDNLDRVLEHFGATRDQRLRPLLAIEPAQPPADAIERLWIVDGTLVPVRDRRVGVSWRNYRFSANVQVVIDADTKLVVAAGRPRAAR